MAQSGTRSNDPRAEAVSQAPGSGGVGFGLVSDVRM